MKLGDFFQSAPAARPVNPRPVRFTLVARGRVLPGGVKNPTKSGAVAADCEGALALLGGDEFSDARVQARRALRERFVDGAKSPLPTDAADFDVELTYQLVWRALREWDPDEQAAGERMFASVDSLRELMDHREADRVLGEYNRYRDEEHPDRVDAATFRGPRGGGGGALPS